MTLLAFVAAHFVLVGSVARVRLWHGVLSLVIPPLAVYWGSAFGMKRRVWAWGAALAAYAITVMVASV